VSDGSEFSVGEPVWDAKHHEVGFVTSVTRLHGDYFIEHTGMSYDQEMTNVVDCAPHEKMWVKNERPEK
jgi:hypothetical protein